MKNLKSFSYILLSIICFYIICSILELFILPIFPGDKFILSYSLYSDISITLVGGLLIYNIILVKGKS